MVYPRPRGGTGFIRRLPSSSSGSIPAHAGEPPLPRLLPLSQAVYPRPRGGTPITNHTCRSVNGLSPPTRGNRLYTSSPSSSSGSIPAHAGEPPLPRLLPLSQAVYPRPRGGTPITNHTCRSVNGLSPPTRGEPALFVVSIFFLRVYPRPRGGTGPRQSPTSWPAGLSPPTRGNPFCIPFTPARRRSIPAHAGEPQHTVTAQTLRRVYPRPCGGTSCGALRDVGYKGLSPPTRGNRCRPAATSSGGRSIPAHAGEPGVGAGVPAISWVYPRPRGGTTL